MLIQAYSLMMKRILRGLKKFTRKIKYMMFLFLCHVVNLQFPQASIQ